MCVHWNEVELHATAFHAKVYVPISIEMLFVR